MNTNNTNNAKNSIKRKSISKNPQYKTENFIVFHLIDLKCINGNSINWKPLTLPE